MGIVLQQTPWIGYTQLHELAADLRISQQIIQFRSGQVQEKMLLTLDTHGQAN
jgi:hypothetical protein